MLMGKEGKQEAVADPDFMNAKEDSCVGGAWWLSHSCSVILSPGSITKGEYVVCHNDFQAGD